VLPRKNSPGTGPCRTQSSTADHAEGSRGHPRPAYDRPKATRLWNYTISLWNKQQQKNKLHCESRPTGELSMVAGWGEYCPKCTRLNTKIDRPTYIYIDRGSGYSQYSTQLMNKVLSYLIESVKEHRNTRKCNCYGKIYIFGKMVTFT